MSKPIKREFGNRSIPAWVTGAGGEKFTDITYQVAEGMAKIAINRPEVRNAFRPQTIIELQEAFSLARDNSEVGVIIFTGTGDEAFCSGGDIAFLRASAMEDGGVSGRKFFHDEYQLNHFLFTYPKPVIAFMDGIVMGGGMGLSQGAAFRLVTERTQMAMPETHIGLFPDVGGGYFLSRLAGATGEFLGLTGQTLGAAEAVAVGLADGQAHSSHFQKAGHGRGEVFKFQRRHPFAPRLDHVLQPVCDAHIAVGVHRPDVACV